MRAMFAFKACKDGAENPKRPPILARPVKGAVDHRALLQDILRRFPKTIARLAA